MSPLIRLSKIIAFILWSVVVALWSVPSRFIPGWRGTRKICTFTQLWNKGIARIVDLRVRVVGAIPDTIGGLIVSNHVSYLDIVTHGSLLPLRYTPKSEIARWPFLGWYLGLSRPIWIDRASKRSAQKTLKEYAGTIKHGIYLIVYPEGTTTDGKSGILPFKSTSFEAAIAGNAPIIPVLTRYKQPPGEPTICWYGDMTLAPHVWQVLGLPSVDVEVRFLDPILPEGRSRKELASFVHKVMAEALRAEP